MKEYRIENNDNERIDVYLAKNLQEYSRSQIQTMIKDGLVSVNDEKVKSNYRLNQDDHIVLVIPKVTEFEIEPVDMPIKIIYEDEYLAVVNKPQGLVTHPGAGGERYSLVSALMGMGMTLAQSDDDMRPGIVHRLDKDTSGLLIVAKDSETLAILQEMFKYRDVEREYLAIVHGVVEHDFGTIDAPIGRDLQNRFKMGINPEGKQAITYFDVIERFDDFTLIKCRLESGRTHQIRVHMRYIDHPILGDPLYGIKNEFGLNKQMLMSYHLSFIHPITGESMEFELPLNEDFKHLISEWSETNV